MRVRILQPIHVVLAWLWCILLVHTMMDVLSQGQKHAKQEFQVELTKERLDAPLLILSWTEQSENKPNWVPFHEDPGFSQCRDIPPCKFTADKARIKESDVVLFRGRRLINEALPLHRSPHQKWIFYEYEPPTKLWNRTFLVPFRSVFNLTSTYSFDSNIPLSLPKRTYIAPNKLYSLKRLNTSYAKNKKPMRVAWFVSNCRTQSQRENYVKELQKHVPVDIYGKCGPLVCGSRLQVNRSACDKALLSDPDSYKFYLSFENSFCDDYVTEKLWRILKEDVVQIVLGAANYSALLPDLTYLNVKDFHSPKALANFLHLLDRNDELYNQYIMMKRSIRIELVGNGEPYHCRLCRYLHVHKLEKQFQQDLVGFWGRGRCQRPEVFLGSNALGVKFGV